MKNLIPTIPASLPTFLAAGRIAVLEDLAKTHVLFFSVVAAVAVVTIIAATVTSIFCHGNPARKKKVDNFFRKVQGRKTT